MRKSTSNKQPPSWYDENRAKMRKEAAWWKDQAAWARTMASGEMLGHGTDGVQWLEQFTADHQAVDDAHAAEVEHAARERRAKMSLADFRKNPQEWEKAKRDVGNFLAQIARTAEYTAQLLELGMLPDAVVERLRTAIREHDASSASDKEVDHADHDTGHD